MELLQGGPNLLSSIIIEIVYNLLHEGHNTQASEVSGLVGLILYITNTLPIFNLTYLFVNFGI